MIDKIIGFALLLLAYLVGSIPWGYVFGKMKGIDIRTIGSKNIGATNTGRALGKKYAYLVYILDMFKGFIFVFLFRYNIIPVQYCIINPMLYGLVAVLGHTFPVYLGFKGGKSVSCGSGAVAGYFIYYLPIAMIVFFITKKITKLVSFASLTTALFTAFFALSISLFTHEFLYISPDSYPASAFWPLNMWFVIFTFLIGVIIFVKHSANIKRIIHHTETPANY